MQTILENVECLANHNYFSPTCGGAYGVSNILSKNLNPEANDFQNSAMQSGTLLHKTLEQYAKKQTNEVIRLFSTMNDIDKRRAFNTMEYVGKLNLKIKPEVKFIAQDDNIKFGGTIDGLCETLVIDYKFSNSKPQLRHKKQIAMYAIAVGATEAWLIYINNEAKIDVVELGSKEIKEYSDPIIESLPSLISSVTNEYVLLDSLLRDYVYAKEQMEKYKLLKDELMQKAEDQLKADGLVEYKPEDGPRIYPVAGKTTTTLQKSYRDQVFKTNPEYFVTKTSNAYYIIK